MLNIIRLESKDNPCFDKVCKWNYEWWGEKTGKSREAVEYFMEHSVNTDKLPQTFVALDEGEPVGMYQLSMVDDLFGRPDVYPWLINVYVDPAHRGKNICRELMGTVNDAAKAAGIDVLYLYTSHVGLYEKFGWELVEKVPTFNEESPIERLYKMKIE